MSGGALPSGPLDAARALARRYRTYRHFRLSQLTGRALSGFRRATGLVRAPEPPAGIRGSLDAPPLLHHDPWNSAEALREGRITFLNRSRRMDGPWEWQAEEMPMLWRFHLHYFDYLHLLETDERTSLCLEWIRRNPPGSGVGWHPYPTSVRLANWCGLFDRCAPEEVHASVYRQAGHLARDLEVYLSGNHLLENARALVLAGLYFGGEGEADEWLSEGLRILRRELPSQVLADGGHYERSPMYHARVLAGCLDLLGALSSEHADRPLLAETARRMLRFLQALCHPDGAPALFNDATLDGAPSLEALTAHTAGIGDVEPSLRADQNPLAAFPDSGYYRFRSGFLCLILDAGPIGPSHQPAHGHADAFSYELSIGGDRWITDSGVDGYGSSDLREYCRSTRAHNTVEVDGRDQAELWGVFRVARRFAPVVEEARVQEGTFRFSGVFEGYRELIGDGVVHRRRVRCDGEQGELEVKDSIRGKGRHRVVSRVHLHPQVDVVRSSDDVVELERGGTCVAIHSSHEITVDRGWYCPRFGVRRSRPVLCIGGDVRLPAELGYRLTVAGE